MPKIKCGAFKAHRCMNKEISHHNLLCCHSCTEYDNCLDRCENKPRSCNKSEIVPDDYYLYTPKVAINRRMGRSKGGVIQLDLDTGEVLAVYRTAKEAALQMAKEYPDRSLTNLRLYICACARGDAKSSCGYNWMYGHANTNKKWLE